MTDQGTKTCKKLPRAEKIAQLNDTLRKTGTGGTVVITQGVKRAAGFDAAKLLAELAAYTGFDQENNVHGERDFGDLRLFGYDLLWKIDYYDNDLKFASEDAADPSVTSRVLTVMLASEW